MNPGVADHAARSLEKYRATRKKQREKNSKKQNLATTNLSDFDKVTQQRIWEQVLQSNTKSGVGDATSVISAVTTTSQQSKTRVPRGSAIRVISSSLMFSFSQLVAPSRHICRSAYRATYHTLSYSWETIWIVLIVLQSNVR